MKDTTMGYIKKKQDYVFTHLLDTFLTYMIHSDERERMLECWGGISNDLLCVGEKEVGTRTSLGFGMKKNVVYEEEQIREAIGD